VFWNTGVLVSFGAIVDGRMYVWRMMCSEKCSRNESENEKKRKRGAVFDVRFLPLVLHVCMYGVGWNEMEWNGEKRVILHL
jgi:hypothetical protein